jgi:hypothetical protein
MKTMRKANDEIYQLAKDQPLVKTFEKQQKILAFLFMPSGCNVCNSWNQKLSFFVFDSLSNLDCGQ